MQRFDKYWIGIVLGLLLPLAFILIYLDHFNLWFLLDVGKAAFPTFSKLCMLGVFPNLALIFVFYTTDTWNLSKGVLIGAFPYMIAAIGLTI
ncbi:MAG: hypothetical protein MJZ65_03345 [Paludibacteraceae bacterium]|nr:hypothetical protein [Paludibacteraceae bacterium]